MVAYDFHERNEQFSRTRGIQSGREGRGDRSESTHLPACLPWLSSSRDNERGMALNVADFVFTSDFRLSWNRSIVLADLSFFFSLSSSSFPFLFLFLFFLFFDSSSHQIGYLSAAATLPPSLPRMLSNGKQNGTRFFYRWLDRIRARSRGEEGRACTKCYLLFDGEIRLSRENTLKFDRYGRMGWKVGRIEDGLLFNGNFHSEMMENDSPCNCSTISTISNTPSLCKTQFPKKSLSLSLSLSVFLSLSFSLFLSLSLLEDLRKNRGLLR